MIQINEAEFKIWIEALRSGKYNQTKRALNNSSGFCCLGVSCDVLIPKEKLDFGANIYIAGSVPLEQKFAPKWLKQINSDFKRKTKYELVTLNDSGINDSGNHLTPFTFDEIADLLEAVYILKVLE